MLLSSILKSLEEIGTSSEFILAVNPGSISRIDPLMFNGEISPTVVVDLINDTPVEMGIKLILGVTSVLLYKKCEELLTVIVYNYADLGTKRGFIPPIEILID